MSESEYYPYAEAPYSRRQGAKPNKHFIVISAECRGYRNPNIRSSMSGVIRTLPLSRVFLNLSLLLLLPPPAALALEPGEIALIVNSNQPAGRELAQFYAEARHIPENRILELPLPQGEEMSFREYEESVVPQVREYLRTGDLDQQVKCFVTFYGVPLRIAARVNTPAESREQQALRQELLKAPPRLVGPVGNIEKLAGELDMNFKPGDGSDLDSLAKRADVAMKTCIGQINLVPDATRRAQMSVQLYEQLEPLVGDIAKIKKLAIETALASTTQPASQPAGTANLKAMADDYQRTLQAAAKLEQSRFDANARGQLRLIVFSHYGLISYINLLHDQAEYLDTVDTASAFDSELALIRWTAYPHVRWRENPLYYAAKKQPVGRQTYMVMRLDAPRPELVKDIINASIKTENEGLKGKVVLDSRGIVPGQEKASERALAEYDQSIRDLGELLKSKSKLALITDDAPDPLAANSADDVALYCGWYSVRNFIDSCKFNPGAVGFHIASYELVSLHNPGETGWVAGLLNHGVVATLGPVAEPFLLAFPKPSDFFPLLLTGKLTLAEVYWRTTPMTSWMLCGIGDPLYNPYKTNPVLQVEDLPDRLQRAALMPATQP